MGRQADEDPLSLAIQPPPNETPEQRDSRLQAEALARRISNDIDEELKAEKAALKKKPPVKVLLLGQSESGKSTTLKNFQMNYAKNTWAEELASWRTVVQLNLLRNVHTILDLVSSEMDGTPDSSADSEDETPTPSIDDRQPPLRFTEKHGVLKLRLLPLRSVQKDLEDRLGASSVEENSGYLAGNGMNTPKSKPKSQEVFVRSSGWKTTLRAANGRRSSDARHEAGSVRRTTEVDARRATEVIASCGDDIKTLWEDETVQEMLKRRRVRLDDTPGFFLADIDRIARRDYVPSDNDVMRARLRTLGVQEHKIHFQEGPAAGMDWIIYDVGGSRTQRPAWFPYFDDCDAIIFLAPVNCFDEKLAEDRRVNRLEDSYALWKMICSSKLLAKTQIILFLNKCDLLEKKLRSGVKVNKFVPSLGDRKNDAHTVTQYFAQHFKEIFKHCSPEPRSFRVHLTSVVDPKATSLTLQVVGERIFLEHMQRVNLM
ncbi:unnamed protein product [Somion occarium]|uniref:G-alpha-domain-containing protein n=1 Tax=Somion occarium TaxID=3059160 RepID=A0ABP1CUI8_9APHY